MTDITCEHCCGADKLFDEKSARKQKKRYLKKGPRKTTRKLIGLITESMNGASSLLEIGGGIGAVQMELMNAGLKRVTSVDASSGYIKVARELSSSKGYSDQVHYLEGDFMNHERSIDTHDVVVMDKVICCYPHFEALLSTSMSKSTSILAVVYPKSNFGGRILVRMGNLYFRFKGNPFRSFMHDNQIIRSRIKEGGFELKGAKTVYPWNVEVYRRPTS